MTMRVIHKLINCHSRVWRNGERTSVNESNTELAIWSCLDDVAEVNEIADLRLTDIGGQIGLNQDRSGVLDMLADRVDQVKLLLIGAKSRRSTWERRT
jgi:hypothetical protein